MKLHFFTKSKFVYGFLLAGVIAAGCEYDSDVRQENIVLGVSTTAKGEQEVPPVSTPAVGYLSGTYNRNTKQLTYNVTWQGLKDSATQAHFHGPASPGQNAGVLITIFSTRRGTSGEASGTVTLADTTAQFFTTGKIYLNIHSKVHPGGELRGQVTVQ